MHPLVPLTDQFSGALSDSLHPLAINSSSLHCRGKSLLNYEELKEARVAPDFAAVDDLETLWTRRAVLVDLWR